MLRREVSRIILPLGVASNWPAYGLANVSIAATLKTASRVICAGFAETLLTPH
jgi:hypothetical protein